MALENSPAESETSSTEFIYRQSDGVSEMLEYENLYDSVVLDAVMEIDKELMCKDEHVQRLKEETVDAVGNVHASHLFTPAGKEARTQIYRLISASPNSTIVPSWRDLAAALQFDYLTISGVSKSDTSECLDIILKKYCTKQDATLAALVTAFYNIKRYDCLHVAAEYFPDIAKTVVAVETPVGPDNDIDVDVPRLIAQLELSLPAIYRDTEAAEKVKAIKTAMLVSNRERQVLVQAAPDLSMSFFPTAGIQPTKPKSNKPKVYLKKVLVTFTPDGRELANRVTAALRSVEPVPIGVLILGEHAEKVTQNPYTFITHQIQKMDYVIPVVTEGYLEALGRRPDTSNQADLDSMYVQLIHDTLTKDYIDSGCSNKKVRCIIPTSQLNVVQNHPHFKVDCILKVFFSESCLELLVERLARLSHCRQSGTSMKTQKWAKA